MGWTLWNFDGTEDGALVGAADGNTLRACDDISHWCCDATPLGIVLGKSVDVLAGDIDGVCDGTVLGFCERDFDGALYDCVLGCIVGF